MEKTYDPQKIEPKWYKTWEQAHYFQPDNNNSVSYCIMLPPPNVTGSLHMGHGFQHTLMDALIRYHRMCGENTLWQPGTDHASIATQMIVERRLQAEGKSRHDVGRQGFLEHAWQWKAESGGTITRQMRRLGSSVDWSRERFTMDEKYSQAVEKVFVDFYNEGLIYRGKRLVNWDPHQLTAISDLEVVTSEEQGQLYYLRYPLANGNGYIVVATSRPETLFGDVAVAVNPDDERYQHFIGQYLQLPLTERTIPIIADSAVLADFGTGCVKITPAHDFNDNAMGQRHQLPQINIFTPNAHLNENVPVTYQGMERFAARKQVITDLEKLNLVDKIEAYTIKIPRTERSGIIVEPYLTDQWFMKMTALAEPAIAAVQDNKVRFIPENWSNTYFHWLNNIQDWCISRQLWWGHQIPAWYDDQGNVYVGRNEQEIRDKHQLAATISLHRDEDVLDTWFSAALWPFATLGWPEKTTELNTFYPTNVLVTGFDIIFFWVARMIMLGLKIMGDVPFKEVYITGLIRDHEGHKMSKSKGNVLDPIDIIDGIDVENLIAKRTTGLMQPAMAEKITQATHKQYPKGIAAYGTDALRFTFCALASTTRDIRFDLGRVEGYRNFCNKLWNAARFVLMNVEEKLTDSTPFAGIAIKNLSLPDQWILTRLQQTIAEAHQYFHNYRFDLLAQAIYEFTWNEYCDWYLELTKPLLNDAHADAKQQQATRYTLIYVLETLLRLLHPLMPYITEEIWQRVAPLLSKTNKTIMLQTYPAVDKNFINTAAATDMDVIKAIIIGIRTIRSEMNIIPSKRIPVLCKTDPITYQAIEKQLSLITALAKLNSIKRLDETAVAPPSAIAIVGNIQLLVPLADLIDPAAERARLNKEQANLDKELQRINAKLSNESFTKNAPSEIITKETLRQAELQSALEKLNAQLELLQKL